MTGGWPANEFARLNAEFGWDIGRYGAQAEGVWRVSAQPADVDYPEEGSAFCAALEDTSWWFQHRSAVLLDLFSSISSPPAFSSSRSDGRPPALWEIGAGNGCVAGAFMSTGIEVAAVEPLYNGALEAARRGIECVVCARLEDLKLPPACLPAVGCFDVLEHIQDPQPFLAECRRVLEPGGLMLITVPAFAWLWGQTDDYSGHHRRYSVKQLNAVMGNSGFAAVKASYFMLPLVFPALFLRRMPYLLGHRSATAELCASEKKLLAASGRRCSITVLDFLLGLERRWLRRGRLPLGTSICAAYRKPAEPRSPVFLA